MSEEMKQVVWDGGDLGPDTVQAYLTLLEAVQRKGNRILRLALEVAQFSDLTPLAFRVDRGKGWDYKIFATFSKSGGGFTELGFPLRYLETPEKDLEAVIRADWEEAKRRTLPEVSQEQSS